MPAPMKVVDIARELGAVTEEMVSLRTEVRVGFEKLDLILRGDPTRPERKGLLSRVSAVESGARAATANRTAKTVLLQGVLVAIIAGAFALVTLLLR